MNLNLHFQIDPRAGSPVYRQLMDQIKYYIASGSLPAESQLPSIRELAQSVAINPTTVVKAYNELAHQGVIELRHGKGAFVCDNPVNLKPGQRIQMLKKSATQLAVEALQLGATLQEVTQLVESEMKSLQPKTARPVPVNFRASANS